MGIVIPGMLENEDTGSVDSKEDFFTDWELKSANRSLSSSPISLKGAFNANTKREEVVKKEEIVTIGEKTARKASLTSLEPESVPVVHHKPITSNILKPNKRSLGAKKATKIINFDEAERLAKEEEKERIRLEEEAKKQAEEAKAAMLNRQADIQQYSRNPSNISNASKKSEPDERLGMGRLGFGFDASSAPKSKPEMNKTVPSSNGGSFGFGGSGFGSIGQSNNSNQDTASTRFGNAKGISSDQYFSRGAYDEAEK
jgi:ADP-ribosylation factor GTPase-activating protein 2/3